MDNKNCWLKDRCNQKDCDTFCIRLYKLNYLYEQALIPLHQRHHLDLKVDKDGSDIEAFTALKNIENNILDFVGNGDSLWIYSSIAGNGKTSWALRMVEVYFDKIWFKSDLTCRALFINVPRFLLALKDNISERSEYISHIKENILKADLVIWDDIATKSSTVFESENLLYMLDLRNNAGKSNIFTSNLNAKELHQALGDRLSSRIVSLSYNIELRGADKRGLKKNL